MDTMKLGLGLGFQKNKTGFTVPTLTGTDGIIIGIDSISQQNDYFEVAQSRVRSDGYFYQAIGDIPSIKVGTWYDATATAGAAPPLFRGYNFGIAGDALSDADARTAPMINYAPKLAVLLGGTNTGTDNSSYAQKVASLDSILVKYKAAGIHVILSTVFPRQVSLSPTGSEISTAYRDILLQFNTYIRSLASNDVTIWDPVNDLIDPQYSTSDDLYFSPLAGTTKDGVHPNQKGAYLASLTLNPILKRIYPNGDMYSTAWFNADPTDAGNAMLDGEMAGTTGTANNGVTGTVASNWVAGFTAAPTYASGVASLVSNTDTGGQSQKIVLSCTGGGVSTDFEQFQYVLQGFRVNEAQLSTGYVRYFCKVRIEGNDDGILGSVSIRLRNSTQNINFYAHSNTETVEQNCPLPFTDRDMWLVTNPIPFTSGDTLLPYLYANVLENVSGTATIYADAHILVNVGDPTSEFPYTP